MRREYSNQELKSWMIIIFGTIFLLGFIAGSFVEFLIMK